MLFFASCVFVCPLFLHLGQFSFSALSPRGIWNIFAAISALLLICLAWQAVKSRPQKRTDPTQPYWRVYWPVICLLVATLGLLASVASLPFLSDDFAFIFPDTLSSATWSQRGGDGFYRPLGNTILALAAHTLPPSPLPWGLWILASNLVVSALAGILGAHLSQQNENPIGLSASGPALSFLPMQHTRRPVFGWQDASTSWPRFSFSAASSAPLPGFGRSAGRGSPPPSCA